MIDAFFRPLFAFDLNTRTQRRGVVNIKGMRRLIVVFAAGLLLTESPIATAQINSSARDRTEKVSEILAALDAAPGKVIADVGAGEGFYSIRIARAVGPTGRVSAVDIEEKSLAKLRAQLAADAITNVDVVLGAADDPRLPDATFDAVLVYNTYHEMTEHAAMRRAIFRALKPGGRLVVSEALHDNLRTASREVQVKEHEISIDFVAQELTKTGFEVYDQQPNFRAFTDPKHQGGFWLLIARKPLP
jgi:ubiquinone/menaquinone biosynthesis C-methylase UbiE